MVVNQIYNVYYMTHVIRVRDKTFDELVKLAKWSQTMDMIINDLLRKKRKLSDSDSCFEEEGKQI